MKHYFKEALVKLMMWKSGKTRDELAKAWLVWHFLTRSKWKAYWRATFH